MKKKISIIGAGITGIYCAILLNKSGHDVEVYESTRYAGGILRDIEKNNHIYFKACQLLNSNTNWFKDLKNLSKQEFDIFEPLYGSYVDYGNYPVVSNNFSIPFFDNIEIPEINKLNTSFQTLDDRISLYDKDIKKFLSDFINLLGLDPNEVSQNCASNIQINRISSEKQKNFIKKIKLENKIYNEIYAVEPKKLNLKYSVALPIKGFSNFFDEIVKNQEKINFYFNSKIFPEWNDNKLTIKTKAHKIEYDYVVWTGNPTLLINSFSKQKMKSSIIRVRQLNFNLKYSNKNFFYTQVFSTKINIYRIYIYQINRSAKISIEMIKNKDDINNVINEVKRILKFFDIEVIFDLHSAVEDNYIRHDITSLNDFKLIRKIIAKNENSRLICSPWDIYSRDKKLEILVKKLNDNNLLS